MKIVESLTYIGPNRRAGVCLIENLIELDGAEQQSLTAGYACYRERLLERLHASGILKDDSLLSAEESSAGALERFAGLYAGCAIALQQAAGHRVQFQGVLDDRDEDRVISLFEYEQSDVGDRADILVRNLFAQVMPDLKWDDPDIEQPFDFSESFSIFMQFASDLILPGDTQAIIEAATEMDIPWVKLERDPYSGLEGDFRVRRNGLLKLGHSVHKHIVDGTFCIDKSERFFSLLKNREPLFQMLRKANVPVSPKNQVSCNDSSAQAITPHRMIVANGRVIGVSAAGKDHDLSRLVHPNTLGLAQKLAKSLNVGVFVVEIATPDIRLPLNQNGGAIVDVDVAPELDSFLNPGSELHQRALSAFVQWLFPRGTPSRVPLISITGTNGKTTTSRLSSRIMQSAGYITGLACSDGVYINGELTEAGDKSGTGGHHRVFESDEITLGVLETARGAMAHSGFMFDWCNVGVCLNVTSDHQGEYGINSTGQMAELKRAVVERARDGVVLCADDEHCLGMLPFVNAPRVCLVSIALDIDELRALPGEANCFALLETLEGREWLVLCDGEQRTPVIAVNDVPVTFEGKARYNVSNALHALAACYLTGADATHLADGLRSFEVNFETSPGRLSFYREHPFTVILDYAHNADGFTKLGAFVDQLGITGKKVVMLQTRGDYGDEYITGIARAAARYFDCFVCRSHPVYPGTDVHHVLTLVRDTLMACGVREDCITTTTNPEFAMNTTLEMGEAGDLLVFTPGVDQREDTWQRIISY